MAIFLKIQTMNAHIFYCGLFNNMSFIVWIIHKYIFKSKITWVSAFMSMIVILLSLKLLPALQYNLSQISKVGINERKYKYSVDKPGASSLCLMRTLSAKEILWLFSCPIEYSCSKSLFEKFHRASFRQWQWITISFCSLTNADPRCLSSTQSASTAIVLQKRITFPILSNRFIRSAIVVLSMWSLGLWLEVFQIFQNSTRYVTLLITQKGITILQPYRICNGKKNLGVQVSVGKKKSEFIYHSKFLHLLEKFFYCVYTNAYRCVLCLLPHL